MIARRALLLPLKQKHVLPLAAALLFVSGVAIAFHPFSARGLARNATDARLQRFSCPDPLRATTGVAGTPYRLQTDPEVPTCSYRGATRLILVMGLFGVAFSLLSIYICISIVAGPQRPEEALPASRAPPNSGLKANALAGFSLGLGIASAVTLSFCLTGSVAAIVSGVVARDQVRESNGTQSGDRMALVGIVLGAGGLLVGLGTFALLIASDQ